MHRRFFHALAYLRFRLRPVSLVSTLIAAFAVTVAFVAMPGHAAKQQATSYLPAKCAGWAYGEGAATIDLGVQAVAEDFSTKNSAFFESSSFVDGSAGAVSTFRCEGWRQLGGQPIDDQVANVRLAVSIASIGIDDSEDILTLQTSTDGHNWTARKTFLLRGQSSNATNAGYETISLPLASLDELDRLQVQVVPNLVPGRAPSKAWIDGLRIDLDGTTIGRRSIQRVAPTYCSGWSNAEAAQTIDESSAEHFANFESSKSATFERTATGLGIIHPPAFSCEAFPVLTETIGKLASNAEVVVSTAMDGSSDDVAVVDYSIDGGQEWLTLSSTVLESDISNGERGGFLRFPLPRGLSREQLALLNVRVRIEGSGQSGDLRAMVDGIALDLQLERTSGVLEDTLRRLSFLMKETFFSIEDPVVILEADDVEIVDILDVDGNRVDIGVARTVHGSQVRLALDNRRFVRPGTYQVRIRAKSGRRVIEEVQTFRWGVAAMNTPKSTYHAGEQVPVVIGVIDDRGRTVCDADLTLTIHRPDGRSFFATTRDGTISVSKTCGPKSITAEPDYLLRFPADTAGAYGLTLDVQTEAGTETTVIDIPVLPTKQLVIERVAPARINPKQPYVSHLFVTPTTDYAGPFTEVVPKSFGLSDISEGGRLLDGGNDAARIVWDVDWKADREYELIYTFDAPDVSPALFALGPSKLRGQDEGRDWKIASDETVERQGQEFAYEALPARVDDWVGAQDELIEPTKPIYPTGDIVTVQVRDDGFTDSDSPRDAVTLTDVAVLGPDGSQPRVDLAREVFAKDGRERSVYYLKAADEFRPGEYTVRANRSDGTVLEQTFEWGTLQVDSNKDQPKKKTRLTFDLTTLDGAGQPSCDDDLTLTIAQPDGGQRSFSSRDGSIIACPDGSTEASVDYSPSEAGTYAIELRRSRDGEERYITSALEVADRPAAPDNVRSSMERAVEPETETFAADDPPRIRVNVVDAATFGFLGVDSTVRDVTNVQLLDPDGAVVSQSASRQREEVGGGSTDELLDLNPGSFSRAGRYTAKIDVEQGEYAETIEQDFTWGVLAVNLPRSIERPDHETTIGMAVLDDTGRTLCDADVSLEVINPRRQKKTFTTKAGSIVKDPTCVDKGFTYRPDYSAVYRIDGEGTYTVTLTAETSNGRRSLTDRFEAQSAPAFDVVRTQIPTRIYPVEDYQHILTISPQSDYRGPVVETFPASFTVSSDLENATVESRDEQTSTLTWQVEWQAGQTYELSYSVNFPDISPEFYLLGPLQIGDSREARQWQVASDSVGGSAEGARLYSSGFELQSTDADEEYTANINTPVIDTTTFRSGAASMETLVSGSAATEGARMQFKSANTADDYFARAYINITTAPAAEMKILCFNDSAPSDQVCIRMNTDRSLELWDEEDGPTQVGSASAVLITGTWYRVELRYDTTDGAGTNDELEAQVDGVTFASTAVADHANGPRDFSWGILTSTTAEVNIDDIAINDDSGGKAINWPGTGKIVHLIPTDTVTNTCDASAVTVIDEINPNGATDTALCDAANDNFTVNVTDTSTAGIQSGDAIRLLSVGSQFTRISASSASSRVTLKVPSGNTLLNATTIADSSTAYNTHISTAPRVYQIVEFDQTDGTDNDPITTADLDGAQIGYQIIDANPDSRLSTLWMLVEYVPAEGGRLYSSGFELQSATAGVEYQANVNTPTISTSTFRSGAAALRANPSASTQGMEQDFQTADSTTAHFIRSYIRFTTAPDANTLLMAIRDTANSNQASIRYDNANNKLELWNEEDTAQIGSDSATVTTGVWYRVEMMVDFGTAATGDTTVAARIDGDEFASSTTINWANGVMTLQLGVLTTNATADVFYDDVAVNQQVGFFQNSYPGEGKIVHLRPNATGDNGAWAVSVNCAAADYTCVDEITPDDATTAFASTTEGQIEDVNLFDSSTEGIAANDSVTLVSVGTRFNKSAATDDQEAVVRLKDASGVESIGGIGGIYNSTTWVSNDNADPRLYPLTAYDRPNLERRWTPAELDSAQIGVRLTAVTSTENWQVSTLWMLVEYEAATGGRLYTTGFELNSATAGVEYTANVNTPTISSTTFRSGAYALRANPSASTQGMSYQFRETDNATDTYFRAYIRFATLPNANTLLLAIQDLAGTNQASIRYDNANAKLELWNEEDTAQVDVDSAVITTGTWYRVELRVDFGTAATGDTILTAKLDGTQFATGSTVNWANGITTMQAGIITTNATADAFFDDMAINQNAGSTQNSYPGDGKVIHLRPSATGDNSAWTGDNTDIDEVTPDDVTTDINSSTQNQIEDVNLDDSSIAGIDTVNVVQVGVRFRNSAANDFNAFRLRLKDAASGEPVIESRTVIPNENAWRTNARNFTDKVIDTPITAYTRPAGGAWTDTQLDAAQAGVVLSTDRGAQTIDVSTIWVTVDYTVPPTITVSGGCFTNEGEGAACGDAGPEAIKVAVNGVPDAGTDGTVDGAWTFTIVQPASGAIMVFFVDGEATEAEEATTIVKYDGSGDVTLVKMYQSQLVIGTDPGANSDQIITVADLNPGGNGYENSDSEYVLYDYTAGADLTVDAEGTHTEQLYVMTGDTFQPASGGGSDTTTHHLEIDTTGVITADSNAFAVAGDFVNNGTFTANSGAVTMNGTSTASIEGTSATTFNNLTIDGNGNTVTVNTTGTVGNILTIGAASDGNNDTLSIASSRTLTLSCASCGALVINDTGGATNTISGAGTLTYRTTTIFPAEGTVSSVVRFSGQSGSSQSTKPRTFVGAVEVYSSSNSTTRTLVLGDSASQTINFSSTLSIVTDAANTMDVTIDAGTYNPTVNVTGNVSFSKSGTGTPVIVAGDGTWTVSGDFNLTGGIYGPYIASLSPTWDDSALYHWELTSGGLCNFANESWSCTGTTSNTFGWTHNGEVCDNPGPNEINEEFRAAMQYDTDVIDDAASILQVQLNAYVNTAFSNVVKIGRSTVDNLQAENCTLETGTFANLTGSEYASSTNVLQSTGVKFINLGSTAVSDVQSRLTGTSYLTVGVTPLGTGATAGGLDSMSGTNPPILRVAYVDASPTSKLIMNGAGKTLTSAGNVLYDVDLSSTITLASQTHYIAGNLNMTGGNVTEGTSTIAMIGAGKTLTAPAAGDTLANLTIDPTTAGTVTLAAGGGDLTVSTLLSVATGDTLSLGAARTLTASGTSGTTLTLNGTISGSGRLTYKNYATAFPTTGTISSILRFDASAGAGMVTPNRTYSGAIEVFSDTAGRTVNASSGAFTFGSTLELLRSGSGTVVFNLTANDATLTVTGGVTIGVGTELSASDTVELKLAAGFSNSGTFTHNTGTVRFQSTATAVIVGDTTFQNFIVSGIGSAKTIQFTAGSTTTVSGTWTVTGASGQLVTLTSTAASQWNINPAAASVSYVDISYANNQGAVFCATFSQSTSGNNTNINVSATGTCGIIISGICQAYDQATNCVDETTVGDEIRIAVNGALDAGDKDTVVDGTWSFTLNPTPSSNDIITVFVNGAAAADRAVAITKYDGDGDITGLSLYKEHLTIGSDDTGATLTSANLGSYDNSVSTGDADVFHEYATAFTNTNCTTNTGGSTVCFQLDYTAFSSQEELLIKSGWTYQPDSAGSDNVYLHDLENNGTFDLTGSSNAMRFNGSWVTGGSAVFTAGTSTVIATATSGTESIDSVAAAAQSYNALTFGETSGTATWNLASALDVNGTLTIDRGTLAMNGANNVNVAGNVDINANGLYTKGSGTWTFDGTAAATHTDVSAGIQNLGTVVFNKTSGVAAQDKVTLGTSANMAADTVDIQTGDTLDLANSGRSLTVWGTGAAANILTITGTLTPNSSSAVVLRATNSGGSVNIPVDSGGTTYASLDLAPGSAETYVLTAHMTGSQAIVGRLYMNAATTLDTVVGQNYNIEVKTNWVCDTSCTFTPRSNTVTLSGTTAQTVTTLGQAFNHLVLNNTGTNGTANDDIIPADALNVDGNLTLTDGHLRLDTNDPNVTVAGNTSLGSAAIVAKADNGSSTWTFDGITAATYDDESYAADLGLVNVNKTDTVAPATNNKLTLGATAPHIETSTMTVDGTVTQEDTLDIGANNGTLALNGTGAAATVLTVTGTLVVGTNSYVMYYATNSGGSVNVANTQYANIVIGDAVATETYVLTGHQTGSKNVGYVQINTNATFDVVSGSNYGIELKSWTNDGTFSAQNGTVTFIGTTTGYLWTGTMSGASSFYNIIVNGSGGEFSNNNPMVVTNDLTMTAGTLAGTNNVTVNGAAVGTAGVINRTGGTFEQRVTAGKNFGPTTNNTDWIFLDLTFSNGNGGATPVTVSAQTCSTCDVTVTDELRVGKSGDVAGATTTLSANDKTWTLSGTILDPFLMLGSPAAVFTAGTSTVAYTGVNGGGNVNTATVNYSGLTVSGGETYNIAGSLAVSGTLNVGASAILSIASGATLTHSGATLTLDGTITDVSDNGWLHYSSATAFPSSGVFSANLRLNGTGSQSVNCIAEGSGGRTLGGHLQLYSDNTRTITLCNSAGHRLNVGGDFTIGNFTGGTVTAEANTNDPNINITGNMYSGDLDVGSEAVSMGAGTWTVTGNVDFTYGTVTNTTGGTLKMIGTGGKTLDGGAETIYNLTIDPSSAATITHQNSNLTVTNNVTIASDDTLAVSSATLYINDPATLTFGNASSTLSGGTVQYLSNQAFPTGGTVSASIWFNGSATGGQTINARDFNGFVQLLCFCAETITFGSGSINFNSSLSIAANSAGLNYTVDAATNDPTVTVTGNLYYNGNTGVSGISVVNSGINIWTVTGNVDFQDEGDLQNGQFNPETNGTLKMTAVGANKTIESGGNTFYDFEVAAGANTVTLESALATTDDVTITSGTLDAHATENNGITASGHFTNNGTFTPRAGTVTMSGTSKQVKGSTATTFWNLVGNGTTIVPDSGGANVTIDNALTVNSAKSLSIESTRTVTVDSNATVTMTGGTIDGAGRLTYQNTATTFPTDGTLNSIMRFDMDAGSMTMPGRTYGGVVEAFDDSSSAARTLTLGTGPITLNSHFHIYADSSNASGDVQVSGSTNDPNVSITGNVDYLGSVGAGSEEQIVFDGGTWTVTGNFNIEGSTTTPTIQNLTMNGSSDLRANGKNIVNLTVNGTNSTVTVPAAGTNANVTGTLTLGGDAAGNTDVLSIGAGRAVTSTSGGTVTMTDSTDTISGSGQLALRHGNLNTAGVVSVDVVYDEQSAAFTAPARDYGGDVVFTDGGILGGNNITLGGPTWNITGNLDFVCNSDILTPYTLNGSVNNPAMNITGGITVNDVLSSCTISLGSGDWTVGGDINLTSLGTLNHNSGLVVMNGASRTLTSASETLYDVTFAGSVATTLADTLTAAGDVILNSTISGGTLTMTGTGGKNLTGGAATLANLTINPSSAATINLITSDLTVNTVLSVADGDTLSITGRQLYLTRNNASASLTLNTSGTISGSTGRLIYRNALSTFPTTGTVSSILRFDAVNGDMTIPERGSTDYAGDVEFYNDAAAARVMTLGAGTYTITGAVKLMANSSDANSLTVSATASDPTVTINGAGGLDFTGTGTALEVLNAGAGNWTVAHASTGHVNFEDSQGTPQAGQYAAETGGTITMSGTGTLTSGGNTLLNFTTSGSGSITLANATHTIAGNATFASTASLSAGSSTVTMTGTSNNLSGGGKTLQNLTINPSSTGTITLVDSGQTTDLAVNGQLTISSDDTLSLAASGLLQLGTASNELSWGNSSSTISGSGTISFVNGAGGPAASGGTLNAKARFDATAGDVAATTIDARTYGGDLELYNNSSTANRTLTLASTTYNVTGSFHAHAANAGDVTVEGATNNPIVNVTTNLDFTGTGDGTEVISAGTGLWTVTGNVDFTGGVYGPQIVTLTPTWDKVALKVEDYYDGGGGCAQNPDFYQCNDYSSNTVGREGPLPPAPCTDLFDFFVNYDRAAMKFSLTTISNTATVLNATLSTHVFDASTQTINFTHPSTDTPDSPASQCDDGSLFSSIAGTNYAATSLYTSTGRKIVSLGSLAAADLQSRITGSDIMSLGIYTDESNDNEALIYSLEDGTIPNRPRLYVSVKDSGTPTLTMNGSGKTLTSADNVLYNLNLSGTITLANTAHSVAGDLDMTDGDVTPGSSTITMIGAGKTLTAPVAGDTLANLTIDPISAGTVTLAAGGGDLTVSTILTVASGETLSIGSGRVMTLSRLSGTSLLLNGTVSGSGRLTYMNATAFPTGGTISSILRFDATSVASQTISSRTYAGAVEVYNSGGTSKSVASNSGTMAFSSTLELLRADTATVTLDLNTVDPTTTTVTGGLTIGAGTTLSAPSTNAFNVNGSYTNNGTFTDNSGTVTLAGAAQQTLSGTMTGSSDFNHLIITNASGSSPETSPSVIFAAAANTAGTFTAITANTKIRFNASSTYALTGINFNGQATGTRVALRSSTPGTQWTLNAGNDNVLNTDVRDSNGCPSAGGDITPTDPTGTNLDSANNTCWNLKTITFALSADTTIGFGACTSAAARYATADGNGSASDTTDAHTATLSTNARNGYSLTVYGPTLAAGGNTINAIGGTAVGSSAGTEQFGMRAIKNSGAGQVVSPYETANWAYNGVSAADEVANHNGSASTTEYGFRYLCNITGVTEAGSYSTSLTYVLTTGF